MSVNLFNPLWVRIEQLAGPHAPRPLPLESGFSPDREYLVLGMHCPSETAEAYFILCNDLDQVWFISNRHFRACETAQFVRTPSPLQRQISLR